MQDKEKPLESLYPFLHDKKKDSKKIMMHY